MLSELGAKTESAPKPKQKPKRFGWLIVAGVVLVVGTAWLFIIRMQQAENRIGLSLERVDTEESRRKGLSGRQSMPRGQGMLFDFDQPGQHCIWMKDMKFSLDIIWLDEDRRVTKIQENAHPDSYPETFCPDQPARYVIEVNSGVAAEMRLSRGSRLQF